MGSKPKVVQTPYSQTNTFTEWRPTETPDLQALRNFQDQNELLAPALRSQYDRQVQRGENEINSAYNARIAPEARLAMLGNLRRNASADLGANLAQGAYNNKQLELQRRMAIAEMTLGRPLQTGSSGYNSQAFQGQSPLSAVIGGAASIASKFI